MSTERIQIHTLLHQLLSAKEQLVRAQLAYDQVRDLMLAELDKKYPIAEKKYQGGDPGL